MSKKVLTIIVPTYNMEDYLDKCLKSLILGDSECELMHNLEVLIVNDGSTDKSSEIAHGYEKEYPDTFKVIDKENGNYGSCINTALPIAKGKYVKVLDADDYFDRNVFISFLTLLRGIQVDAILTNVVEVNASGKTTFYREPNLIEKNKVLPWQAIIPFSKGFMFSHHFTFRRQILIDMQYKQTEGVYYSDMEWVLFPMTKIETIYYLPMFLYKYFIERDGQSTSRAIRRNALDSSKSLLFSLANLWKSYKGEEQRKVILHNAFVREVKLLYTNFALYKDYTWSDFRCIDNEIISKVPQVRDVTNKIIIGGRIWPMPIIKYWREKQYFLFLFARLRYQVIAFMRNIAIYSK